MKRAFFISIAIALLLLVGCSDKPYELPKSETVSWGEAFDGFWGGMSRNYVFWGYDGTDWDAIYDEYKPRFDGYDIENPDDDIKALNDLTYIIRDLVDGHFSISIEPPNSERSYRLDPNIYQMIREDFAMSEEEAMDLSFRYSNFGLDASSGVFSDEEMRMLGAWEFQSERYWALIPVFKENHKDMSDVYYFDIPPKDGIGDSVCGIVHRDYDGVVYVYISEFNCYEIVLEMEDYDWDIAEDLWSERQRKLGEFGAVLEKLNGWIQDRDGKTTGLVVDLRGNPGGYIADSSLLWGAMLASPRQIGYSIFKDGENRHDYADPVPFMFYPNPNYSRDNDFDKPIAVILNRGSVSMSETSAMFFRTFDSCRIFGGQSFGAFGGVGENKYFNAGQFSSPYISSVYTAGVLSTTIDGECIEGNGIIPDEYVPYDMESLYKEHIDARLDAAMEWIHGEIAR